MAQAATNHRIEELRFRLKTDPKSRLFYPLAEELRKAGQSPEAEQVLRSGLGVHPTYLSAWVSLGRVSRELKKDDQAVEALSKALQLDPGNVVAARLLADAYYALGEKVEAIKKYKLVHALLPTDQEVQALIERLERELGPPPAPLPVAEPEPETASNEPEAAPLMEAEPEAAAVAENPFEAAIAAAPEAEAEAPLPATDESPFAAAEAAQAEEARVEVATADVEPMLAAHEESPFEEPVADYTAAAFAVEAPAGMHIARAPLAADVPAFVDEEEQLAPPEAAVIAPEPLEEADVFAPAAAPLPAEADNVTNTITMADLYARQGLTDDARHIYETILARDPDNEVVRGKLNALSGGGESPAAAEAEAPAAETSAFGFEEPAIEAAAAPETATWDAPANQAAAPFAEEAAGGDAQAASFAPPASAPRDRAQTIAKLENWLAKVTRRELGRL